jgi:hypothetical protein
MPSYSEFKDIVSDGLFRKAVRIANRLLYKAPIVIEGSILQRQVQASQRQPGRKHTSKPSDFSEEYAGKRVVVTMHNGLVMEGLLLEARKYWFKIKDSQLPR